MYRAPPLCICTLALVSLCIACGNQNQAPESASGGTSPGGASDANDANGMPRAGNANLGGHGAIGAQAGSTGDGGSSTSGGSTSNPGGAGASGGTAGDASGGAGAGGSAGGSGGAGAPHTPSFETRALAMDHVAEGAAAGDIDGDGIVDLVAGPRWYRGPDFELGGTLIENPPTFTPDEYSSFFLTFLDDLNADGRLDVIAVADAGRAISGAGTNAVWFANPGPENLDSAWTRHALFDGLVSNESPLFINLVGDARKELVFMTEQQLGYAAPGAAADAPWTFTAVTGSIFGTPYVHGLGAGDIDGDGLLDLVERSGWWRQTASGLWEQHEFDFGTGLPANRPNNWGGAQMLVYDVDGDADADVVTALSAHGYGVSWFEQQQDGTETTFVAHPILPPMAELNNFSQPHALVAADMNGDGLTDFLGGKRYYAHPSRSPDPGTTDPAVLYWFELRREPEGATFVPHEIHMDSGAGCNFVASDLTGNGRVDVFTTNKRGTFLHLQR